MSAPSRHAACKTCRERKVRCDGGLPSCEKCERLGETCVYIPPAKQTKGDLIGTIESLQEKLDKAEAQLNHNCSQRNSPTNVPGLSPSIFPKVKMDETKPTIQQFSCPPNLNTSWTDDVMGYTFPEQNGPPVMPYPISTDVNMDSDGFELFPWCSSLPLAVNEPAPSNIMKDETQPHFNGSSDLPSLRDIRAWSGQQPQKNDPDASKVLRELNRFVSATFANQAHISGTATAVAEYLAWVRKAPDVNHALVLATLETRLQETANLANTKHWMAFKDLQNSLGHSETFKRKLSMLEEELKSDSSDTTDFFSERYDIRSSLDIQRRS